MDDRINANVIDGGDALASAASAAGQNRNNSNVGNTVGTSVHFHYSDDDESFSTAGSSGGGGRGGISMTQDVIAWDSDEEGDGEADHARSAEAASAADAAQLAKAANGNGDVSGAAAAAASAGTGGEVDLRSLIFRSPVPPPSTGKRRSSHSGTKRSGGGGGGATRGGGSTTSSGSSRRLKSRRKKSSGGSSSSSGRRSSSSRAGREVRLFESLLDGADATTSPAPSVSSNSSGIPVASTSTSRAGYGHAMADASIAANDMKPSPAEDTTHNADDETNDESLIPTQERSNVTEEAAAAAASAAASSGSMESQEDEKIGAIKIAAGSRRRLRRINTHDGVATATSGNTASNISIYNALETNDSPDLSIPASSIAAALPTSTTGAYRHPTAMQDIEDMATAGDGSEDQMKKRRRPAAVRGPAASLYGKENNRMEDHGIIGGNKSKKVKTQLLVPQQHDQSIRRRPLGHSTAEVSAAATTSSAAAAAAVASTTTSSAVAAGTTSASAAKQMEGVGGIGSSTKNGSSSNEPDPFENLLQQIDHGGIGVKSPMPIMKREPQQLEQQGAKEKTASTKTTVTDSIANIHANASNLSLSQPNPYTKPMSAPSIPQRPGSPPVQTSSAQTYLSTGNTNRGRPSTAPSRISSGVSICNVEQKQHRPQKVDANLLPRASGSVPKPMAGLVPVQPTASAAAETSVVETQQQLDAKKATVGVASAAVPAAASLPVKELRPHSAPSNSVAGDDDLLGGIDFNDDVFAAMDDLVAAKEEQVTKVEAVGGTPASIPSPALTPTSVAPAMNPPAPIPPPTAAAPSNSTADDDFGDFPDLNFEALDEAIGRKSLDAQGNSSSTSGGGGSIAHQSSIGGVSTHMQQAQGGGNAKAKEDEVDFGDFPDLDFAAMDQLVESRPSSSFGFVQDPFAVPPSNVPVWNKATTSASSPAFISFTRYKVVSVQEDLATYTRSLRVAHWVDSKDMCNDDDDSGGTDQPAQILATAAGMSDAPDKFDGCIHLRGEWFHTECEKGDTIHLCSLSGRYETVPSSLPVILHSNPPQGSDPNDDLVLIVHPDTLLTPTNISETVSCVRRAVLKMRLGSSGLSSEAAIVGTMRHDLFEACMQQQDFSTEFAQGKVDAIVRSHSDTLVGCQYYDDTRARHEVLQVLPQIRDFASKYCSFGPAPKQRLLPSAGKASMLRGHGFQTDIDFTADAVYATEEAAISPELGLKGFVDATLGTTTKPSGSASPTLQSLMGLELKTGHRQNPQNEHMAQLALYTLMLRMRRGSAIVGSPTNNSNGHQHGAGPEADCDKRHLSLQNGAASGGMLLYLNHEAYLALHISPVLSEVKSLIGQRNVLATDARKAMKARGVVLSNDKEKQDGGVLVAPGGRPSSSRGQSTNIEILPAPPAQLPEMVPLSNCTRCYSARECMMYAASDVANAPTFQQSHGSLMNHYTAHLSPQDMQYFLDWDRMIDLESRAGRHDIAKAWLKSSQERERTTGKTFSDLVFAASYQIGQGPQQMQTQSQVCLSDADDDKTILQFDRAPSSFLSSPPLNSLKIEDRSHVVLSTDGTSLLPSDLDRHQRFTRGEANGITRRAFRHQMNVFRGIVQKVSEQSVTILASKNDLRQLQDLLTLWRECNGDSSPLRFRLDKDEVATGTGTLRQNLIKLFTADIPTFKLQRKQQQQNVNSHAANANGNGNASSDFDSRLQMRMPLLRRAIIQMERPQFDPSRTSSMFDRQSFSGAPKVKGCDFEQLSVQYLNLNVDQRHAVDKIISMNDYACIQGLPGTGKTSTIAFIARLLAAQGKRVLITSYTHAAVDNLLMKLMEGGVHGSDRHPNCSDLVRIGNKSSCHPDLHPILATRVALDRENLIGGKPSAGALYQVISEARIVGCTALTVPRTPLLAKQHFDVAIVDEAGQISQPAILGALMSADSFVLVGDHMQLPPLVADDAAEQAGYGVSMLKRLAERQPESIAKLTLQYRMHENICNLCNEIVYGGELKCANETVRTSKLILSRYPKALPVPIQQQSSISEDGWLQRVLNPDMPAVFVDTDAIGCSTTGAFQGLERSSGRRQGGTIVNDTEVSLVRSIVRSLLKCGLNSASIGVICPYRSQLRLLDDDKFLRRMKKTGLEMSTIDRYQGRDKAAIVISLVRSNTEGKSGRLLEDFRRLNVAISRAKRKLIIVGSMKTLTNGSDVLRPVLQSMSRQGWVERLPCNATEMYESPPLASQTNTTQSTNLS